LVQELGNRAHSLDRSKFPKKIRELFEQRPDHLNAMLDKLRLAVVSRENFSAQLRELEDAADQSNAAGQTLQRLPAGFRAQFQSHQHTT
jgi:hypothetical protein